jgi:hypothetical protein
MDLLKVYREVRGMPGVQEKPSPDYPPAMGGVARELRTAAKLGGSSPPISQTDLCQSSCPDSADGAGSLANMMQWNGLSLCRARRRSPGVGMMSRPDRQALNGEADRTDGKVVLTRMRPVHRLGVRAPWRKSKRRLVPARRGDCTLRFFFPQGSRHLPFPFRNARVEVGRTVMEG